MLFGVKLSFDGFVFRASHYKDLDGSFRFGERAVFAEKIFSCWSLAVTKSTTTMSNDTLVASIFIHKASSFQDEIGVDCAEAVFLRRLRASMRLAIGELCAPELSNG